MDRVFFKCYKIMAASCVEIFSRVSERVCEIITDGEESADKSFLQVCKYEKVCDSFTGGEGGAGETGFRGCPRIQENKKFLQECEKICSSHNDIYMNENICAKKFNLQFFAEERTEEATPRKREKVREEGRVCVSKDLNAAVGIITALLGMTMLGALTWQTLTGLITFSVQFMGDRALLQDGWLYLISWEAMKDYFASWLPLGGLVVLFSTCTVIAQVGFAMTGEPFGPKFDRLNPFTGMKKIISLRSVVELLKGLLKASIFAVMIYSAVRNYLPTSSKAMQMPLLFGSLTFWDMLWGLAMRLALMLLVMAFADYFYQKWDFEKSIRMSKKEIKDEYKQMEGDPQIKSKIRQKQREMAKQRMMADVPKADVVITNPTHIAVALVYERQVMGAPQVIAKGGDYLARRIREIAQANLIPIIENKPLAWALYQNVEIGEEIPEDLYKGVAEILAMVYKLKAK